MKPDRGGGKLRRRVLTLMMMMMVVVGVVLTAAACSDGATEATDPPAEDVVLRVVADNAVLVDWTLAELEAAVPYSGLTLDGDEQSGPLLVDVLAAAGVTDWNSGQIFGMGEGRAFEVTLNIDAAGVDDGWILDVTNQGTLKLASADLPREQWVRDVGEIRIP